MAGSIEGCRARLNENLLPGYVSIECTVSGRIHGPGDVEELVLAASKIIGRELSASVEPLRPPSWEYIGRSYNLYSYSLKSVPHGSLRVVELGGLPVNVSAVIPVGLLPSSILEAFSDGELAWGDVLGTVYAGEWCGETAGQVVVPRPVVYAVEGLPETSNSGDWAVLVKRGKRVEKVFTVNQLREMEEELGEKSFHCVTGWSIGPRKLHGIPLRRLLSAIPGPGGGGGWVGFRSAKGYTVVVPWEHAYRDGLLVTGVNGRPLRREHGYPLRLFFPTLYGWKSLKWLTEILVLDRYEDGYWEARGYHERGRVGFNERFKIRNPLLAEEKNLCISSTKPMPPEG